MSRRLALVGWLAAWPLIAGAAPARTGEAPPAVRGPAPGEPAEGFTGSAAYRALRRSGRQVVVERELDLDGDGRADVLVVARGPAGMDVAAYWNRGERIYELLSRSQSLAASQVAAFAPVALGDQRGFYLDAIEDNPDEADHDLLLFLANAGGLRPLVRARWREIHSEEDAGREPLERVDLGGRPLGLGFAPAEDPAAGGWPRVVLRDEPKVVELRYPDRPAVELVLGSHLRIYSARKRRYRLQTDRFDDYLRPVPPTAAAAAEGTEAGSAGLAIDGDPKSGWRAAGPGASLELSWSSPATIRALRLVPGCGPKAGRVRAFSLAWPDQPPIQVDRARPQVVDRRLLGFGDYRLGGGPDGLQTLVFFLQPIRASRLTLTVEAIEPGPGGQPGFCLGEVTPLAALVDGPGR